MSWTNYRISWTNYRRWWILVCVALLLTGGVSVLRAEEAARGRELRHLLRQRVKFPGLDDPKLTLTETLDALAKRYNLSFDLNQRAFKDADIKEVEKFEVASPNPIPEMNTKLGFVLKKILDRVSPKAMYVIRDDMIEITTQDAVRKEFFTDRPTGPLPPLVSARFEKVKLTAAFKELSYWGNIVLDSRAAKEGETAVTADLTNVPLDTAVRMLADMAGLKVIALENALYVTDKENVRVLMEEQEILRRERQRDMKEKADKPEVKPEKPADKPAKPAEAGERK